MAFLITLLLVSVFVVPDVFEIVFTNPKKTIIIITKSINAKGEYKELLCGFQGFSKIEKQLILQKSTIINSPFFQISEYFGLPVFRFYKRPLWIIFGATPLQWPVRCHKLSPVMRQSSSIFLLIRWCLKPIM